MKIMMTILYTVLCFNNISNILKTLKTIKDFAIDTLAYNPNDIMLESIKLKHSMLKYDHF